MVKSWYGQYEGETEMQLRVKRSQIKGMMGGIYFAVDAKIILTDQEMQDVIKYHLHDQEVYYSEGFRKNVDKALNDIDSGTVGGALKSIARLAALKLQLKLTFADLMKGAHVECKNLDELMGAEQVFIMACERAQTYLTFAKTYIDEEETVREFNVERITDYQEQTLIRE